MSYRLSLVVLLTAFAPMLQAQEKRDPRRPAAIETQEVPVIPAAIFQRQSQYRNVRAAGFAGWSPDGRGILVRTRFANSVQLHRVYRPGGRREQITFFDEPVRGSFIPKDKTLRSFTAWQKKRKKIKEN